MGRIVVTEFVSLDGVFEDPGGAEDFEHGGWTFEYEGGDDFGKFKFDELMESEAQLLGRRTYDGFIQHWPSASDPFADKLNADPKYVVSTTLTDPEWQNTTVLPGVEEVAKLRDETSGTILVHGSGQLAGSLLGAGLVDELHLLVYPTVLGRGKRLFPEGIDRLKLKLTETRLIGDDGIQLNVYERAG